MERIILDIFKDTPSHISPYMLVTQKVAEVDVTDIPTGQVEKIVKIQDILGRRIKQRRVLHDPPNIHTHDR